MCRPDDFPPYSARDEALLRLGVEPGDGPRPEGAIAYTNVTREDWVMAERYPDRDPLDWPLGSVHHPRCLIADRPHPGPCAVRVEAPRAPTPAADGRSTRRPAGEHARAVLARSDRLVALSHADLAERYFRLRDVALTDRHVRWLRSSAGRFLRDKEGATEAERRAGCPVGWYRRRM